MELHRSSTNRLKSGFYFRTIPYFANRAFNFIQIACGRIFLDGMGIRFSDLYICLDAKGEIVETGRIQDEPYFVAAMSQVQPQSLGRDRFMLLALSAADVHAVDDMLQKGSRAENLVMSSAFVFLETSTEAGLRNAERIVSQEMQRIANASKNVSEG